jgi:hypothetical protein
MGKEADTPTWYGPLGVLFASMSSLYSHVLPAEANDLQELWSVHWTYLETLHRVRSCSGHSKRSDGTRHSDKYRITTGQTNYLKANHTKRWVAHHVQGSYHGWEQATFPSSRANMIMLQETSKRHAKYPHGASERLSAPIDTRTSGSTAVTIKVWGLDC